MWYQIKSYIHFLINSKNQHGIHSPFVYDLLINCFYDKSDFKEYTKLRMIRKEYSANKKIINIEDLGDGSRVFRSNKRSISSIAKKAGITHKNQKLLFRLIRYFNSSSILELGTSLGLATSAMSLANTNATILTVEGCPTTANIAKQMIKEHKLNNIVLENTSFEEFLKKINDQEILFDLIYLDGNHNKESTLHYYKTLLDHIGENTVFILDDIHWSPKMEQAWIEIIDKPEVTVSIDTYNWGLIFFRKEQRKQHFRIRL
jgi:predicted O-methyltransferase YrrM